jgi:ribosomal protection tetracycline resistance protein
LPTLNLGILAHVDAGKTTLTERLLHAAGAIDAPGSVDEGTTHTDTLALERRRGITIRAAVVAFTVGDLTVNIVDTPGHPDFIAEVERSLGVLDGAVLVVSAVEGVQAQTVVLMRALRRLALPTMVFVNKVDRAGADPDRALAAVRERLTPDVVPMGRVEGAGGRGASFLPAGADDPAFRDVLVDRLAEHDEALLHAVVEGATPGAGELRARLVAQTARARVHPLYLGSAATGAGVADLTRGIATLLPTADGDAADVPAGQVFKVERDAAGRKVTYVRMFSGTVRVRDRLPIGSGARATVTAVRVIEHGAAVERPAVVAGQVATLSGLREVRVGDAVGTGPLPRRAATGLFAPPALETAVVPRDAADRPAVQAALARLAEQDPLIDLRHAAAAGELYLSLYGEVQKEVIGATLAAETGIDVEFRDTTTICVERPAGTGSAVEWLGGANPFLATVGLRVEPAPPGSGVDVRVDVGLTTVPLYVYGTVAAFRDALEGYVVAGLRAGPCGWQVVDCIVTLVESDYSSPGTGARDVRKLTQVVLADALRQAGTVVCEPIHRFRVDAPTDTLPALLRALTRHRAVPDAPSTSGGWSALEGTIPAAELPGMQRRLRGLTHGEGVLEAGFDRYEPAAGVTPRRRRG